MKVVQKYFSKNVRLQQSQWQIAIFILDLLTLAMAEVYVNT